MKLAILSDIHGNWPALQAVVEDLPKDCAVACCGDFVGYYPYINEVCDWARESGIPAIRGNHDAMVLGILESPSNNASAYRIDWTRQNLSSENLAWLGLLPIERQFVFGDTQITLRHASPWDETTYLFPDSPRWSQIALIADEVLVIGHTHHPLIRKAGDGLVVNPGSVGQPRDYDPRPSYALLDEEKGWKLRRVSYDYANLQRELERLAYAPEVIGILGRTKPS